MKNLLTSGKRKRAVARACIKQGTGVVKINNRLIDFYEPEIARLKLQEPLMLAEDHAGKFDISIKVFRWRNNEPGRGSTACNGKGSYWIHKGQETGKGVPSVRQAICS